jgi:hypothetical protein
MIIATAVPRIVTVGRTSGEHWGLVSRGEISTLVQR